MRLPESKPDSPSRMMPKGASGRQVRHFVRRTASRLRVSFTRKHNATSTSYLPSTNVSRVVDNQTWSPMQSACTSPDSFWSYYSRSEVSRISSSSNDLSDVLDTSTRLESTAGPLQLLQPYPCASISGEQVMPSHHECVADSAVGRRSYPSESTRSGYQASLKSRASSCCSRSSDIRPRTTTRKQQLPHAH